MDLLHAHGVAISTFDSLVRQLRDDQWALPTPDEDWTVRDLVNHLTAEQLWVPELLAGRTVAEVGDVFEGDILGNDPIDRWIDASSASRDAFLAPDILKYVVHLSYGDSTAADYCAQMTFDLAVHSWDLARAIGADEDIDPELTRWALRYAEAQIASFQASRLFHGPLDIAAGADDLTRLLAITGRRR